MTPIRLSAGDLVLEARPDLGGAVTAFRHGATPLFRPTPDHAAPGPAGAAFALAPFPNRIAYGRFAFDGEQIALPADPDGAPHALHGEAWRAAWRVDARDAAAVEFVAPPPRAWPWRYDLRQRLALAPDGLDVTLTLRNEDTRAMPAGLGWHPAFARRAACHVRLDASGYLPTGPDNLPLDEAPLPPRWTFATGCDGAAIAPIDHCLTGWDGRATLVWPDIALTLSAPGCSFLQAYAPADGDFLCLEPQTCAPDAVNRDAAFGLRRLAPGETMTLRIRIDVTPR